MTRAMNRVSVIASVVLAVALGAASEAEARLMENRDVREIADRAAARIVNDDVQTINDMLAAQGLSEGEIRTMSQKVVSRLVKDVRAYAASLAGHNFPSFEDAEDEVEERWLILRFSALNAPHLYASGRPLRYVVTEGEMKRMERSLVATWIEREPLLRKKLDEMVMMNELAPSDVSAVRQLTKTLALERGKDTIAEIRGATFFSPADADYFLECAVVAEIERIRGEKLGDPANRKSFVEDAVVQFGAQEAPLPVRQASRPVFDTAKGSIAGTAEIDFNK